MKVYINELPKTPTTNYYTTLQGRYQEEQNIMTPPLAFDIEQDLKYS